MLTNDSNFLLTVNVPMLTTDLRQQMNALTTDRLLQLTSQINNEL